jgi:hypothetical protein
MSMKSEFFRSVFGEVEKTSTKRRAMDPLVTNRFHDGKSRVTKYDARTELAFQNCVTHAARPWVLPTRN